MADAEYDSVRCHLLVFRSVFVLDILRPVVIKWSYQFVYNEYVIWLWCNRTRVDVGLTVEILALELGFEDIAVQVQFCTEVIS